MGYSRDSISIFKGIALGLYADALENEIEYLLKITSCETVFVEDEEQADKILSLT